MLWKPIKLPFGITVAGMQRARIFAQWLAHGAGLRRGPRVSQVYVRYTGKELFLEKETDDLLISGD